MSCLTRSLAVLLMTIGSCAGSLRADEIVQAQRDVVIAGHPLASQLGMDVLKDGGNAIDALVTVSLSLNVTEPGNSGLGGKLVLLYYDAADNSVSCIVALDAAPLKVDVAQLQSLPLAQRERGWKSICTPGLAAALAEAHKRWGSKPWPQLVMPAADLAEKGFTLSPAAAAMLGQFNPKIDSVAAGIYAPDGHPFPSGATLKNPDLAHTLRLLADEGPDAIYRGPIAQKLVDASRAAGGWLTLDDLKNYHPRVLDPLKTQFRDFTVYSSPPPLTGGVTLLMALDACAQMDWHDAAPRNAKYIDLVSRVMQQVYPAVARNVADTPDAMERVNRLLSASNISELAKRAQAADPRSPQARPRAAAAVGELANDDTAQADTTHLIIVDRHGDIVCCTQSLGLHFGAEVAAPGTGFLLNADIGNFAITSESSLNFIAGGKWPRSTMSPTIFFRHDRPVLAIGSPAGQRIPTAVLQVSLDVLDFNRPLEDAIRAPRFHIESSLHPDSANHIDLESSNPADLDGQLTALGWNVHRHDEQDFYFGCVNAVLFKDGNVTGVADQRRTSDAVGD